MRDFCSCRAWALGSAVAHLYDVLEKTELKRKKMDEGFPVVIVVNHKEAGLEGFFPV